MVESPISGCLPQLDPTILTQANTELNSTHDSTESITAEAANVVSSTETGSTEHVKELFCFVYFFLFVNSFI